jgi:hypothetical protein
MMELAAEHAAVLLSMLRAVIPSEVEYRAAGEATWTRRRRRVSEREMGEPNPGALAFGCSAGFLDYASLRSE